MKPGPKRPFNFIGILDQDEINRIQQLINLSKENNTAHAIVFGHYPTSSIISQSDTNIRSILGKIKILHISLTKIYVIFSIINLFYIIYFILKGNHRESMVYLCGHYHTFGNMIPNMYTLQKAGFLELELADWKNNRM